MIMKKGIVSLLAMTAVITGSYAASAETLKEALAAAYNSNPQLLAQRAALRAVDEGVSRAKSGFLPILNGSVSYSESKTEITDDVRGTFSNDTNSDGYSITASQNIFRGFQDRNRLRQAKNNVTVGRAQLLSVEQQVLLDAVSAYMNVVRDNATVDLNQSNIQVLERQLQASQDRFRVGEVTRTDVAQSEARLEGAKSTLLNSEAALNASRAQYRRVVGDAPGTLSTPSVKPQLPVDLDTAIEQAREFSPGVKVARGNERAANDGIKTAKGALLPSLDFQVSYSDRNSGGFNSNSGVTGNQSSNGTSIGIQLTVPLYAGGSRYSDIRRAKRARQSFARF
ncbi:MAG: TolC family outer membrane protein [Kordiimonadaceae bacterium]|nr:TolC family outer membrane protein [Kordiimonadaceae bacterium]